MDIRDLDIITRNRLAEQYLRDGMVVLPQVALPRSIEPPVSDVVLLRIDGRCEVYIEAASRYMGNTPAWREIASRPEAAGTTRLVASVQGDFFTGLNELLRLISVAAEETVNPRVEADGCESRAPQPAGGSRNRSASQLTDIAVVHKRIEDINQPVFVDETELAQKLEKRVLGQPNAVATLSAMIVRHCARRHPSRPAVVFAVGPSGVGKTRTAEVLADVLRELTEGDNLYQFLRLDMTEYQEAHRVSQLIGAPQGYVGHEDGSQLVDALRANPRSIILFDEIEKAHPAILRVLMNAMDAGRLSTAVRSSTGRQVDCRYAVFMFTSNLDAKEILDDLEARAAFGNRSIEDDVCRRRLHAAGIAPEIVGRIGRFLVYRPLSSKIRAEIMALSITEVAQEYGLTVAYVDPNVIVDLMEKVRSESYGVRPERFLIDDALGSAFAKAAVEGCQSAVRVCGTAPYRCEPHYEASGKMARHAPVSKARKH